MAVLLIVLLVTAQVATPLAPRILLLIVSAGVPVGLGDADSLAGRFSTASNRWLAANIHSCRVVMSHTASIIEVASLASSPPV